MSEENWKRIIAESNQEPMLSRFCAPSLVIRLKGTKSFWSNTLGWTDVAGADLFESVDSIGGIHDMWEVMSIGEAMDLYGGDK